ncbi:hypothetical protein BROC_01325 [Candidatus Brocadiaceae bacterium]|nr:hypothetical protein BROC_01325 [Candidatus Brocadiaceae bacterium]
MEIKLSQTSKLYELLSDGNPHRTDEIVNKTYSGGSLARVGARIWDIQKKYGVKIRGWHDSMNPKLYWYQIVPPEIPLEETPEYEIWNNAL